MSDIAVDGGDLVMGQVPLRRSGPPAPLLTADLVAALRPFGASTMLPRRGICRRCGARVGTARVLCSWMCLGRSAELGVGCTHRYHLDGRPHTAPGMGESFDVGAYGLVELAAVDWRGWVFVNATGTARSFGAHLGRLDELVAPYQPERLVTRARQCAAPAGNPGAPMLRGRGQLEGDRGELRVFPDLLVSVHPDYVTTHRMVPLAPDRTLDCEWLVHESAIDPSYAVEFWDLTNRQDRTACESVQQGVASPHFQPGPLSPKESAVYDWVSLLARAYLDPAGELGAEPGGRPSPGQ